MQLASLASLRSNCMKRRVGAILVRNNRILATGCANVKIAGCNNLLTSYLATMAHLEDLLTAMKEDADDATMLARHQMNVSASMLKRMPYWKPEERGLVMVPCCTVIRQSLTFISVFPGAYSYFSCPCLKCTIKIIQTGVKEVVYNLSYKVSVHILINFVLDLLTCV